MKNRSLMLVAGEASGDQHAAHLVQELKLRHPDLVCFGLGGDCMAAAGVEILHNLVSHAVIGIAEVFRKLGDFFDALREAERLLRERRPDALILIDLPDMNLRIAAKAKALGIPVIYYISPQVWAWRSGRIKTLKRLVDAMIVIFPFEEPIYQKAGVPVTFVGHPLMDSVKPEVDPAQMRQQLLAGTQGPLVALVPGSRSQEIESLLPVMAKVGREISVTFPHARYFIPLARTIARSQVEAILAAAGLDAVIVTDKPYAARAAADLAIVSSGTATLETAILNVPMIIGYRMHFISYILARMFVKLPYFGLANLVAGEKIAPEFLQHEFCPERVTAAALTLLKDAKAADAQRQGWDRVRGQLGGVGAAGRAADAVLKVLDKKK
jgi:lipid-A-disaccharide synthase